MTSSISIVTSYRGKISFFLQNKQFSMDFVTKSDQNIHSCLIAFTRIILHLVDDVIGDVL
jgi:hypothetical protein